MELSELRDKIDALDDQLLALFLERMELSQDVAAYKKEHQLPILNKTREREILALRFHDGRTQMEVAKQIGISQAQVSRLEKNALSSVRKAISS